MADMRIVDLEPNDEGTVQQVAALLVEGFREHWPEAWPDLESALETVRDSFGDDKISRVAIGAEDEVLGWIGGLSEYDGNVWELHPMVVSPKHQQKGIGSLLVADLEERVRERGALTLRLGSDDDDNQTTLSGIDLYPNVWEHIANIKNLTRHPYEFYRKLGFVIVGVMPDANGFGRPDIIMAKRIARP